MDDPGMRVSRNCCTSRDPRRGSYCSQPARSSPAWLQHADHVLDRTPDLKRGLGRDLDVHEARVLYQQHDAAAGNAVAPACELTIDQH